jgi:hypothetical protein
VTDVEADADGAAQPVAIEGSINDAV